MVAYSVVAINKGKVVEVIKVFRTFEKALAKLKCMNRLYYQWYGDSFAIVVE